MFLYKLGLTDVGPRHKTQGMNCIKKFLLFFGVKKDWVLLDPYSLHAN